MSKVIRLSKRTINKIAVIGAEHDMPNEKPRDLMDVLQAILELDEALKNGTDLPVGHPFYKELNTSS